jgi:hypothetical protein
VETAPSVQKILDRLEAAQTMQSLALIVGESGVGKTTACRRYVADERAARTYTATETTYEWENDHIAGRPMPVPGSRSTFQEERRHPPTVRLMELDPSCCDVRGFLIELAAAMGDDSEYAFRRGAWLAARRAKERIERFIGDALDKPCLLIVDNAQHLSAPALEQVRSIHELTGIAIALVGNPTVAGKIAPVAAVNSLVAMRMVIGTPEPGDIDAVAAQHGIADKAARKHLRQVGAKPGGLHKVVNAIRFAAPMAGEGEPLQLRHLQMAGVITGVAS